MTEYERIKAWRKSKEKDCPGGCGNIIQHDSVMCRKCNGRARTERAKQQTLADIKTRSGSHYSSLIRQHARKVGLFESCDVCGYDKHVEVCHVKPIASFLDDATLNEINAPENLRGLCPNHHWELDNGMLKA